MTEGIYNIAKKLNLQKNYTRLSGLLLMINAPRRITERGIAKYSLTDSQIEVIRKHLDMMRREINL